MLQAFFFLGGGCSGFRVIFKPVVKSYLRLAGIPQGSMHGFTLWCCGSLGFCQAERSRESLSRRLGFRGPSRVHVRG